MVNKEFGRLITAMVSPFDEDGNLSVRQVRRLAEHLANNKTEGIVVSGTTGESPTLSEKDRLTLIENCLNRVGDQVAVIAGTSTYSTEESVKLSREARNHGAHGLLLVTPYYNKPSQEGLYRHFATIAEAVDIPCILYNVPSRTNVNLAPETVLRLAGNFENIVGLKEAVGTSTEAGRKQVALIMDGKSEKFKVWSGNDQDTLYFLDQGGHGVISVASHVVGNLISKMINHHVIGEREQAEQLHNHLMPLFEALFPPTSPEPSPAPIKAALNLVGMPVGDLRLPLVSVPQSYQEKLQVLLAQYQVDPVKTA